MGLDIVVYERIQLVPWQHEYGDECHEMDHVRIWKDQGFPRSARGLELGRCYLSLGDSYSFRAGSYSGYNTWREQLCRSALNVDPQEVWSNEEQYQDKPFFELIHFSDCEGSIGPAACADLHQDFLTWGEAIRQDFEKLDAESGWGYYVGGLDEWAKAFATTAGTGLVYFC